MTAWESAQEALYALMEDHGWADHYGCGWEDGEPPSDGMCGKEWQERESVKEMVQVVARELGLPELIATHDRYRDALMRISNEDYRGPEPWSRRQAVEALFPTAANRPSSPIQGDERV